MIRITVLCGKYTGNSSDDRQSSDECTTEATSTHGFTHGQQHNDRPRPYSLTSIRKSLNDIHMSLIRNQSGKKFTGILPKSRFFGRKWLNILLGEANMKELAIVKQNKAGWIAVSKAMTGKWKSGLTFRRLRTYGRMTGIMSVLPALASRPKAETTPGKSLPEFYRNRVFSGENG